MNGEKLKNYINGEWVESVAEKTRDVINPATGDLLAKTPMSTSVETERAIEDFVYRNVEQYAIMKEYLEDLYGYIHKDKDIEEHLLSGPTYTKTFPYEELEPYREYLRRLFGRYSCSGGICRGLC